MDIIIILITFILFVSVISAIYCHYSINISRYNINNEKISNKLKIVHLSDLHSRVFGKNNKKLISMIINEKPDIIVMTGDMVNGKTSDIFYIQNLIQSIKDNELANCSIYYIMGNREFRLDEKDYITLKNVLKSSGVIVLENDKERILDKNICICGLNYNNRDSEDYYNKQSNSINNKFKEVKKEISNNVRKINACEYNILLLHDPSKFEEYSKIGFDIVFAGHIHGGVIRLPLINKGVLSPEVKFFPKYDAGIYKSDNSIMLVSKGLGYGSIPFRIFNRPEIVCVILNNKKF